jgi:hypothetical protein
MMSRNQAVLIGQAIVDAMAGGSGRWRVVESSVREVSFGWVLWYNSTEYLDGDLSKGLYGPGPMCFNKVTWDIKNFGSLTTLEEAIAECERCWRANSAAWKANASGV